MKLLLLTLAAALLFTAGEALTCHRCIPKTAGQTCEVADEICKPGMDVCAAAKFLRAPFGYYQKCMTMSHCDQLRMNAYINIKCCDQDRCNTFST